MQIKVNKITKEYDKKLPTYIKVLDQVSLEISEGEAISIIGPTGGGKTTLIEHLNALLIPDSGAVNFKFVPISKRIKLVKPKLVKNASDTEKKQYQNEISEWTKKKEELKKIKFSERVEIIETDIEVSKTIRRIKNIKSLRKQVGVVFQFAEYQLFESTIEKDIIFGPISMGMKKEKAKELAKNYIKLVGLPEDYLQRSPFDLSGGQKRRVALAGILAMEPKFLVLDEPTAGLDPQGVEEMLHLFYELYKQGKTIVLVTHDLDNALRWTKRTIFVKQGKIIYDGDTYNILSNDKFLEENDLIPTKLLSFTNKLRSNWKNIGKVTSLEELANSINNILKGKKNE
ncbi:ATP-binding cassette domain-containing protein [Metamycoplasma buccale]|uniref:ATP-binding cassette domain-containing protein n=1 Tax=Metamycoplasma buccale TaxID=55602 RepID=UPI00398F39D5